LEISIFKKNPLHRIFIILLVSFSVCNKKIFIKKKYGVPGLVFKIHTIDGKKWVKFVAMQQDNATLIYDLNTKKGTVESYLIKYHNHSKQYISKLEQSHLVL